MAVHGKNTKIWIDDATGTPVDISTYSRSINPAETTDIAESSNFNQADKTHVVGMSDEKVTLAGTFATAFLQLVRAVKTQQAADGTFTSTLRFAPGGNATGAYYNDREVLVTQIAVTATTGDVVTMSVDFQRTGPTTDGAF